MSLPSHPTDDAGPVTGIEIADAGTRMSALTETRQGIRSAVRHSPMPLSPEEVVERIAQLVQQLDMETGQPASALGIAVNGQVDAASGVVHMLRYAPGWEDVALAAKVAEATGVPVYLDSTTNAAALAEARRGAGAAFSHMLYVLPAQSVTIAYVIGGQIFHGAHGMEGQVAHLPVREGGPRCSCGAAGHVEPLASAQAIVRTMIGRAAGSDESTAAMLRVSHGRAEAMSAAQVARLAEEGEPVAAAVLAHALDALAVALICALAVLDPDVVVLGGPLAAAGPWYLDQLRTRLEKKRHPFAIPPLIAAALEPRAVLLGAAQLAAPAL
ncbi:MAG TPA: ROK family protein [Ktedonobacterales bacterium]|nr:ROK family protein [Ktedonobacterales bacterium]